jgi:3-ketosteroid 9alpha-monooxygenase subunit A
VSGETIQCPFHHWRFDQAGTCVDIPYCDHAIPKKARLSVWPVVERNGLIHVWYHPHGEAPDFDLPTLPNHNNEGWLPWRHAMLRIKTHSKEIVENVVDVGHFAPVHGTHVDTFENEFDGVKAIQRTSGIAYPRGGGKDKFSLEATYYGPGFQVTDMTGYLHSLLVNAHTMVDENTLDLRFGVCLKPMGDGAKTEAFAKAYVDNLTTGFLEDVRIWENKAYRKAPVLCKSDGPIMKLRKWYSQFYEDVWGAEVS